MADIIVQNAIKQVVAAVENTGPKINYISVLGSSLDQYLSAIMVANDTVGSLYFNDSGGSLYICDLSDEGKISRCTCNYSGSGTNSPSQNGTDNPWVNNNVLLGGAAEKTISEIVSAFTALDRTLKDIENQFSGVSNDIYIEYISLKSALAGNSNVSKNWYGVGLGETPGAFLSSNNRIKVCGSDWKFGEGASCTWTVPAGATQAKFQVWGAGVGSNPGCCCGGAPFAMTGGYAEIVLNVVPGETYTACAGCSCSRYCCSSTLPGASCISGVTGPGICCLKAGAQGSCSQANCNNMNYVRCSIGAGGPCHKYQSIYCTDSGPCWCSNNEYCYDNSCETCGVVPTYPSCCGDMGQSCSCATTDSYCVADAQGVQRQHRGIIGNGCLDTNNYGYHVRPPIIDSDTGLEYSRDVGCSVMTFTSGTCCGGCNGKDWTWHPGHGGAATHIMGGTNDHKGDTGRGGMVQISWV